MILRINNYNAFYNIHYSYYLHYLLKQSQRQNGAGWPLWSSRIVRVTFRDSLPSGGCPNREGQRKP